MTYNIEISEDAYKAFKKLQKKNKKQLEIINKKIKEIMENPNHYKPLRNDMKGIRRVHIDKSFVLTYKIDGNTIIIIDFDHHDKIYLINLILESFE
ncbi:mRNA interferase RelE/StbE/toxin YoeB [Methanococcus maripaludis]|uniref:Plasmid stabilization system protein n=1 Tax=Methanococcus maripaludis TaxID=39152 RepID=A0A2L1CAB0_METMI|nr:type II toxin-antitoxin system mRNA interferase toxin, RelE/StbE family [Methanococcus maripaludis]AVB76301.1 Plasmid stabilization system protein [Methanococcus maripaludis]MBA2864720.1 mRNA interferase RelE/StbE/toxin YoeB [Methanococcus maripaludis]MBA2869441.1 mRNA interferase RelE/StbE/toxin YoeB [Methanococcus maripaludis]MBB6401933.1 mRNA interferase RelE/StbE/toxin YoeB [Methanococcus maripaludis]